MAEVMGPGLAGILIKVFGAPLALVMDAILLIGSVVMLKGIRINEQVPPRSTWKDRSFKEELMKGLNFVRSHNMLIEMAVVVGAWQFFAQMALSVQIIFAVKDLGLDEALVALSFVAMGLGSVLGGMAGPPISKRLGLGPALILGICITSVGWLSLLLLEGLLPGVILFAWMLLCFSWGATLLFVNFLSLRQSYTPTELLGRMTTTMRWLITLPAGPGAILGGWMAEHVSMRSSLLCAGLGTLAVAAVAFACSIVFPLYERRRSSLLGRLGFLLLVHGLEVDLGQVHGRKASAGDHIGHVATQVRVDDLRASDAHDRAHLVVRQVADFKNTSLLALDQEHGFVANFGVHGGGHADLKHAFGYRRRLHTQLDVHAGLLLLKQDGRGIRLLQRSLFKVHALDLENGI
jgi:hypothetical protein